MNSDQILNLLTVAALFVMTVGMGLELKVSEFAGVAKDKGLIVKALIANFVIQPAVAVALLVVLKPTPMASVGIVLLAACPAAHYAMPFTKIGKGNLAAAAGLLVLLALSTIVFAPLVLDLVLPLFGDGSQAVHVPASNVVKTVGFIILLPLAIGMALYHWAPALAERLRKPVNGLAVLLNVALIAAVLWIQGHQLEHIKLLGGWAAMVLLAVASLGIGWAMGGPSGDNRMALAHNTLLRNMGPALVIATSHFAGSAAAPVIVAATFVNGGVGLLAAYWWKSRAAAPHGAAVA